MKRTVSISNARTFESFQEPVAGRVSGMYGLRGGGTKGTRTADGETNIIIDGDAVGSTTDDSVNGSNAAAEASAGVGAI